MTTTIIPSTTLQPTTPRICYEVINDIENVVQSETVDNEISEDGGFSVDLENVDYGDEIELCTEFMRPVDLAGLKIDLNPTVEISWRLAVEITSPDSPNNEIQFVDQVR